MIYIPKRRVIIIGVGFIGLLLLLYLLFKQNRADLAEGSDTSLIPSYCPIRYAPNASSPHFALHEFHSGDGTKVPESVRGTVQLLMQNLEELRAHLGNNAIQIHSGYRSPSHNTAVGGVSNSRHKCGEAADIKIPPYTPLQIHSAIEYLIGQGRMTQGGLGLYDTFIHYDIRGYKSRWDKRKFA